MAEVEACRARSAIRQTEYGYWGTKDSSLATVPLTVLDELRVIRQWAEEELNRQDNARWRAEEAERLNAQNCAGSVTPSV